MAEPTGVSEAPARSVVLTSVWRARWVILAAILLAGIGGYLLSAQQTPTYSAQGRLLLGASQSFEPLGGQSYSEPTRHVANQAALIRTYPVLDIAVSRLDDGTTAGDLDRAATVQASGDDDMIVVTAEAPTAEGASDRANALMAAYQTYVVQQVAAEADRAVAATGDPGIADQIRTYAALYGDGVALVESAGAPSEPASPNPLRNALILAAIAGLVAVGVALWRRPAASTEASVVEASGARVLGTVPTQPLRRGRRAEPDPADFALPLVALDYARQGTDGPVLITAAGRNSGAAAVAHGLAVGAAVLGRRVLMVDSEPGSRELLLRSGATPPRATLDALGTSTASEGDVLVPLTVDEPGAAELHVAALGSAETAPVHTEALRQALTRVAGSYDLILIQAGPVSESSLALALLKQAEVVVAAVGQKEDPEQLSVLRDRLESAKRDLVGIVVTRRARGGRRRETIRRQEPRGATAAPTELSRTR